MADEIPVTLYSLAGGRAAELFQEELQSVIENVMDPNTELETTREIKLTVKIKPDGERRAATVDVLCTSKIAPIHSVDTRIFFGKNRKGDLIIVESNPEQLKFDHMGPQVVNFETGEIKE